LIGVQDEDSCGKSSLCETPQACRGGSRATRGKRSLARKSIAELKSGLNFVENHLLSIIKQKFRILTKVIFYIFYKGVEVVEREGEVLVDND
jgi:hypothetical protein